MLYILDEELGITCRVTDKSQPLTLRNREFSDIAIYIFNKQHVDQIARLGIE